MIESHLATIIEAKDRDLTIRFVYEDVDGVITSRIVDPARFDDVDNFLGWCCHREEYRKFKWSRMHLVELGPSPNEVHLPLGEPEELGR